MLRKEIKEIKEIKNNNQNTSCSRYNLLQKYLSPSFSLASNIIKDNNIAVLVINNALPEDIYNQISNDFISLKDVFLSNYSNQNSSIPKYMLSNYLYKLNAKNVFEIKKTINDILEYHFSKMFHVILKKIYNEIFSKEFNNQNIDINFNYYSPVCYLDKKNIITDKTYINNHILGWLLMRKDEDTSIGGNLEIYNNEKRVISIPYQKNCLVLLLNNNQNNSQNNQNNKKNYYTFTSRNTTIHSMRFIDFVY